MNQATKCKHCGHALMVHISKCHVKNCECPGFEPDGVREGRNWTDSKCAYGYMTLCAPCAQEVRESNRRGERSWSHVDATKEVPGFPVFECERCKKACAPPDNNAYQQEESR